MTQATPAVTPADVRTWHDNHYRRTSPENRAGWWEAFERRPGPLPTRATGCPVGSNAPGGDDYGTLMVSQVNGRPAPQRIIATPKASYPYRRDRAWLLEQALSISALLKYDGTNICQYSYHDQAGSRFTSFKLRTRPFVPPRFQPLLARTLARYPGVAQPHAGAGERR